MRDLSTSKTGVAKADRPRREPAVPYSLRRVVIATTSILAGFLLLLMLYVLSYGPAMALCMRGYLSYRTAHAIYAPIEVICATPFGGKYIEPVRYWYVRLWV